MSEQSFLGKPLTVINIGLDLFADCLHDQQQPVIAVQWEPPAKGDSELLDILDDLL